MPYQKPRDNHPWRQYADRPRITVTQTSTQDIIHIRIFLTELVENWEKYEIATSSDYEGATFHKVATLPQDKIAYWLSDMLKKNYVTQKTRQEFDLSE